MGNYFLDTQYQKYLAGDPIYTILIGLFSSEGENLAEMLEWKLGWSLVNLL